MYDALTSFGHKCILLGSGVLMKLVQHADEEFMGILLTVPCHECRGEPHGMKKTCRHVGCCIFRINLSKPLVIASREQTNVKVRPLMENRVQLAGETMFDGTN